MRQMRRNTRSFIIYLTLDSLVNDALFTQTQKIKNKRSRQTEGSAQTKPWSLVEVLCSVCTPAEIPSQ